MNENLLKIEVIRNYLLNKKVKWTNHCLNRLNQRNILLEDDYPYPSCLILGYSLKQKALHLVCGITKDYLYMITAYYPDSNKWDENMKTRR